MHLVCFPTRIQKRREISSNIQKRRSCPFVQIVFHNFGVDIFQISLFVSPTHHPQYCRTGVVKRKGNEIRFDPSSARKCDADRQLHILIRIWDTGIHILYFGYLGESEGSVSVCVHIRMVDRIILEGCAVYLLTGIVLEIERNIIFMAIKAEDPVSH